MSATFGSLEVAWRLPGHYRHDRGNGRLNLGLRPSFPGVLGIANEHHDTEHGTRYPQELLGVRVDSELIQLNKMARFTNPIQTCNNGNMYSEVLQQCTH